MKNSLAKVLIVGAFSFVIVQNLQAQSADSIPSGGKGSRLDYGYGTDDAAVVTIGSQVWFVKNLNVDHFANGEIIPEAKTEEEWKVAGETRQPAWSYYKNDAANGPVYGRLYNWFAVNDRRGLAPSGWHIPSDTEWDIVITRFAKNVAEVNKPATAGYETRYFTKDAGIPLKSTGGWKKNGGTNTSGFAGLPGGNRFVQGQFNYLSQYGGWWTSSEDGAEHAWYRGLYFGNGKVDRFAYKKSCGFSVRCVKD